MSVFIPLQPTPAAPGFRMKHETRTKFLGSFQGDKVTQLIVKVVPLFEPGKRRMWHVCALPEALWGSLDLNSLPDSGVAGANSGKTKRETKPETIVTIKRWSLAWSAEPAEAESMSKRLHLFTLGQWFPALPELTPAQPGC
jgi:hypothetical protein